MTNFIAGVCIAAVIIISVMMVGEQKMSSCSAVVEKDEKVVVECSTAKNESARKTVLLSK